MTRLTNSHRYLIRRDVMADIPCPSYDAVHAAVKAVCLANLPPAIVRALKDPALAPHIACGTHHFDCISSPTPGWARNDEVIEKLLEADETVKAAHAAYDEALAAYQQIDRDLRNNLRVIKTVAEFEKQFPELLRYLPKDAPTVANLPTTTALMDALKAAGLKVETADA